MTKNVQKGGVSPAEGSGPFNFSSRNPPDGAAPPGSTGTLGHGPGRSVLGRRASDSRPGGRTAPTNMHCLIP